MSDRKSATTAPLLTRRAALLRLGLGTTAAYVAPALLTLSSASASSSSGPSKGRYRRGSYYCGASGPCDRRYDRRRHYKPRHAHGHSSHPSTPYRRYYPEARFLFPQVEIIIRP